MYINKDNGNKCLNVKKAGFKILSVKVGLKNILYNSC